MINQATLKHPIQKHIIQVLKGKEKAHFSELRPRGVDTNLVTYHLKLLIRKNIIMKIDKAYTLDSNGLAYVCQPDYSHRIPRIISMFLIQNSDGQILLRKRSEQPYINMWTLPFSEVYADEPSIYTARESDSTNTLELKQVKLSHVGDCYIRVSSPDVMISTTLAHVFRGEIDKTFDEAVIRWVDPRRLANYDLAPAIEQVIARSFFGDEHFFAEFEHHWSSAKQ